MISEPDWRTLAVDLEDRLLACKVSALISDGVRQGWIARRLPALLREAGLSNIHVEAHTVILGRLHEADSLLGLSAAALTADERGLLTGAVFRGIPLGTKLILGRLQHLTHRKH